MASAINAMICETTKQAYALLKSRQVIFWDFDGVIKDSVTVKSIGYERLFMSYGGDVVERVRQHHKVNGGVSRYEKIPLYLSWAGEPVNNDQVQEFCGRFSDLVQQSVIDAPWVPGVRDYLQANHTSQYFVLMTATPQEEIEQILCALDITPYFREVHGAPTNKTAVVGNVLERLHCPPEQTLVVGDSDTDLNAAEENKVAFLLRRTPFNQDLQKRFQGSSFEGLNF
jgi:phosphoglycolate phosphatase-like HAD superfamily hydrolase